MITTETPSERVPQWTLGDRLRKARSLTGMNTREFAEHIGVSQPTVTAAENDRVTNVKRITLNAWSMATGVPVEWLLTGEHPGGDQGGGPPDGGTSGPVTSSTALDELKARKRSRATTTDRELEDYYAEPVAA